MACERGETSTNVKRILPRQSLCTVVLVVSTMSACSSPARVPDKAEAIRNGDALAQKGQYVQAAAAYRMAVGVDPTDGELRMKLANTYWSAENWGRPHSRPSEQPISFAGAPPRRFLRLLFCFRKNSIGRPSSMHPRR